MKSLSINHSKDLLLRLSLDGASVGAKKMHTFISALWFGLMIDTNAKTSIPDIDTILRKELFNLRGRHRVTIGLSIHVQNPGHDGWIRVNLCGYVKNSGGPVYRNNVLFKIETGEIK